MSCVDNTDILRIVGGNSFQIAITVKARRVSDGSEIEDFDLSASSPVLNLIHAGEKTRKYFVTQGNQAIISFDGSEGLGYYGMEMSGSYNSEAWRFCIEKVLQLVDTNAKANIPEWSVLVDDTYFVEGTISIYGGGGGGDTVQADWTETNPTSAAFILHKPDLSVYATKTEVASGLAGKQDTIADLTSIRYGAAAGATAYQKPGTGIPESDMSEGVQSALGKADSAYQKPVNGIPATDMDSEVQAALEKANSAVQTETDPVFSNSPAAEITQADINNWNAKQPAIADLADIREGAAAGATAVQPDEMAQAIDVVDGDIADINAKIPAAASNLNQLADKAYVNSSIATNSATYRGSFNLITDLGMNVDATHAQIAGALATAITTADNNDYAFVQIPDSASTPTVIAKIERYKHNGSGWVYEYDLNNSGFTAAQWAAINSGITSGLVGKLADLPNNSELATLLNGKQNVISDLSAIRNGAAAGATAIQPADLTGALNDVEAEIAGLDDSKQDVIEDLSTIRSGASAGATAYQKPSSGIPESDMSEGVQSALDKAEDAYQLPANGIPSTDMDAEVQASLEKANSAVQTESDPVFSGSPAAEITQADINNWNAKQPAIADLADIREGAAAGAMAVQPDEMAQAIDEVDGDIADINAKIPATASNLNQLADKAYVNSSIATNSATYRGSFNLITDLGMNVDATHAQIAGALATAIVTADNNDYAFVQIPDSASTPTVIAKIERYKHNGSGWVYEYDLNNSGFTAAQWAAINSGITSGLVGKLSDLPNNSELATLLNGKQNVINDLSAIRSGASAGATAYQKPSGGIPASDMSSTVQQELSKANTAVQTETDPIFSASPAAGITAQNIQTWNGEPAARQAADTVLQNSVSTLQTDLAAETSARQSADAALQTAIQDEATARTTADALLQQQYNALTQSDIIVGALPASGVPNFIYRVPGTTDFTDYMWYGNQFVPMATYGLPISAEFVVDNNLNKTQEEVNEFAAGVFDISVANAVGGTPTTYSDLSAALGTNGANVPQGFRKGGMSVKFIQTSDNKYVQYFLRKNTWSASEADWEKVNLESKVDKIERYNDILSQSLEYSLGVRSDGYDVIWGYAIDAMYGDIAPSISFSCIKDYFPISDYDSITAKVGGTSVLVGPRFYDSSWKFEGTQQTANSAYFRLNIGSTIQGTVEVFKNGNRIYPLGYNKSAKESDLQAEVTRINGLYSRLNSVEEVINGSTEPQVVFGGYISNANIVSSQGWTTVYAKMKPNQTVSLVSQSTDTIRYAIYKEKPVIGDNSNSIVGSMVTGSASATLPNELQYYYIGFSIQKDISVAGDIYIDGELYVSPSMDERVTSIEKEVSNMDDSFEKALPKPFYGNLLYEKCPKFVEAMKNKNKDVTVCLTGTSLTQGNLYVSLRPDRLERPPLMHGYDLTSAVFDVLSKLWPGQKYRRFDHPSVTRSQSDWSNSPTNAIWDDSGNSKNGYTGSTVSPNAFIRFTVPSDAWRFNFIYRTDSEGGNCAVSISEGNNKMEVWNGSNWVEANGFTFSMLESAPTATKGNTCFQKRLNMRCKNKASGGINSIGTTKTLTISKGNDSSRFNVVGFEWSPREFMLTVINGARGGHCWGYQTEIGVPQTNDLQQYQDLDLWEFKPDLIMCEVTTINWAAGSERAIAYDPNWFVNLAKRHYFNEFNDCNISLYAKSNGYTDCEVLFYGDTLSVAGTNANVWDSNGKQVFGTVAEAATNGDVDTSNVGRVKTGVENYDAVDAYMFSKDKLFIPVTERVIQFAEKIYGNYPDAFVDSGATGETLSYDETHLNDRGVRLWASFILPLFDLF